MKKPILILAALSVFACSKNPEMAAAPVADENTVRNVAGGEVIGLVTDVGAHSWRGVPYAQAPIGDLRWRAPRAAKIWDGARIATEFAERCPQATIWLDKGEGVEPGLFVGSEDCLFLDIYAPPDAQGRNLPVMVWIHGGANVWGRSSFYDGSNLALNEDVIIVAVQYRLGPLGWFSHQWLRDSAETPRDASANFATLDLIASLDWVKENIATFGGNPDNVTIFGQSAGGHNVATLLASPLAKGLFHRAILQSGRFDSVSVADAESGRRDIKNASADIVDRLGVTNTADLRATPVETLFDAYGWKKSGVIDLPRGIEDGVALPAAPLRAAFASTETFNAVPIITGVTRDEAKLFYFGNPALTKKFLGIYFTPADKKFYDALSEYPSRVWRILSVDEPAAMMAAAGHEDVYGYRFDWDNGGKYWFTDLGQLLGAGHAVDFPFVFNRFVLLGPLDKVLFNKQNAESRQTLSRAMGAYWAAFARNGAPGNGDKGLPEWPRWAAGGGSLMRFDSVNDGGIGVMHGAETVDALIDDLRNDDRIAEGDRCRVAGAITPWSTTMAVEISEELGCPEKLATGNNGK